MNYTILFNHFYCLHVYTIDLTSFTLFNLNKLIVVGAFNSPTNNMASGDAVEAKNTVKSLF